MSEAMMVTWSIGNVRRGPRPRPDALINRERIMVATCEAFIEHGTSVSLDEIARQAGIGNATLYRHFPNRRELIRTVALALLSHTTDQAEAALAQEPTPFEAVQRFLHQAVDEHFAALCPMLADHADVRDPELVRTRSRLETAVSNLVEAAQQSGRLRPDINGADLTAAVAQLARPLPGVALGEGDHLVHRHLELLIGGLSVVPSDAVSHVAWCYRLSAHGGGTG
ncbi:TetR family transcriptional regulator [Streptomyces fagopyri]|uniref:TetR family transcriptional regulator n=1 Tax=Streptomyces fagopyri TaxID=2662397 RepID=A0A5Q0LMA8_9ACTN|nr:TetR/AcrR family transcriptional regulator [Streptomyces fagopyri]QFZ78402.1 TetR family transcriptional regulator [Streptomyces fagopyri]